MGLITIIKANLKSKKSNFISIFILIFIISAELSIIISSNMGIDKRITTACDNSNIGDIITYMHTENLTENMIKTITESKLVEKVTVVDAVVPSIFKIKDQKLTISCFVVKYDPLIHPYKMYAEDGISLSKENRKKPQKGEIYLPIITKDKYDCEIGDQVIITTPEGNAEFTITQFYEDPFTGGSLMGLKNFLISDEDFNLLYANTSAELMEKEAIVHIYLKEAYRSNQAQAKKLINEASGIVDAGNYTMTFEESYGYQSIFTNIMSGITSTFAIFLYIVVLIIIGHSVNTSIEMDYVTFGILKAEGFTSHQIRLSILFQYLFAGITSTAAGMLVGATLIKYLNAIFIPVTGLCTESRFMFMETLIVLAGMLLVMAIYVMIKTRKVVSISPMQAIAYGRSPIYFSGKGNIAITGSLPLSVNVKITIKQLLGEWQKYITTVLIMALLIFFTMSITAIRQLSSDSNINAMYGGYDGDIAVKYSVEGNEEVKEVKASIEDNTEITNEFSADMTYLLVESNEILCRILDRPETAHPAIEGRAPKYDNEIMITQMVSDILGEKVGDKVIVKRKDVEQEYMITGICQDTADAGKSITMLVGGYQKLDSEYRFSEVRYEVKDKEKITELVQTLKKQYASYEDKNIIGVINKNSEVKEYTRPIVLAITSLTLVAYLIAFVFAGIVSCMISTRNFMREQSDMGVYKSVGFTTGSLRRQFTGKYVIIAIIGGLIGIICNLMFSDSILSIMFHEMGITKYVTDYSFQLIAGSLGYITLCTAVFTWLVSGKIKKVSPKNLITE